MIRLRTAALAALIASALALPGVVHAYGDGTPDEQPPAEEVVCNPDAGLGGAAYGLCVAYCEANDCERQPDKRACRVLFGRFQLATGGWQPPCIAIDGDVPR